MSVFFQIEMTPRAKTFAEAIMQALPGVDPLAAAWLGDRLDRRGYRELPPAMGIFELATGVLGYRTPWNVIQRVPGAVATVLQSGIRRWAILDKKGYLRAAVWAFQEGRFKPFLGDEQIREIRHPKKRKGGRA